MASFVSCHHPFTWFHDWHYKCEINGFNLTIFPLILVPRWIARPILGSLLLPALSWTTTAAKHVLEELELSLGHRDQKEKSPEGLWPVGKHGRNNFER